MERKKNGGRRRTRKGGPHRRLGGTKRAGGGGGGGRGGGYTFSNASEFFSRFARERAVSSACVGGPANNAGLVFLNPRRGILAVSLPLPSCLFLCPGPARRSFHRPSERRRVISALTAAAATATAAAAATSGSRVPFSFYFLFIRRTARPGENGLTVPRMRGEGEGGMGRRWGGEGRGGDPPNELSRLLKRGPRRAAVRPRIEERERKRGKKKVTPGSLPWPAARCVVGWVIEDALRRIRKSDHQLSLPLVLLPPPYPPSISVSGAGNRRFVRGGNAETASEAAINLPDAFWGPR